MISKIKYNYLDPLLNNKLEITYIDKTWDLHDDSDFNEVRYNILENKVMLIWNYPSRWFREIGFLQSDNKYLEEHDIGDADKKIALIFDSVHLFEVKPKDTELPATENICISDITKFYMNNDGNISEDGSISFTFQNGIQIRIKAEIITFDSNFN